MIKHSNMSAIPSWDNDYLARLGDIEDMVIRYMNQTECADKPDTSRLDDRYQIATRVMQEEMDYLDQTKTYTNLERIKYPSSPSSDEFDGSFGATNPWKMDTNNNHFGSSSLLNSLLFEDPYSQACVNYPINSNMENVYPNDPCYNLSETTANQDSYIYSYSNASVTKFLYTASFTNENSVQSTIDTVKTDTCVRMPYNDLEIKSKPYKMTSYLHHAGGEVSNSVSTNSQTKHALESRYVDTTLPIFKDLLRSLSNAPKYDPEMKQCTWLSQMAVLEREMTSPTPATVDWDREEVDKGYKKLRKSKTQKLKRSCRLWEFIRNLLLDPETNPSIICWENRTVGSFRMVNSKKIAHIWGMKKGNEGMTYEKLSRAMRYYYKSQVFLPVHGKRLVYKFGPTAVGWKE